MQGVVTFLLAHDTEAALAFYRDTLGFNFLRDDGFALVFDLDGVMLRINAAPAFAPAQHTVLGWQTDAIEKTVVSLAAKGVVFSRHPHLAQDERGICSFPNGDKVAWFRDPTGNVLSITQFAA